MKNINKILITLLFSSVLSYAADEAVPNSDLGTSDSPFGEVNIVNETSDSRDRFQEVVEAPADDIYSDDDLYDTTEDENKVMQVSDNISEFEKLFVNHSAHIYYTRAIDELHKANYKAAYENAMKAKVIYDNTDKTDEQVIALPYMPSYVRDSAYTAKRIYYKVVKPKPYELKRLITKAKLISPPIASVVLKRTSTYMDLITKNYGDLPLDEFEVLLNDESIVKYEKILPNEQKVTRIELAPTLYEISFKEKYGFAPNSIMLSEGE